MIPFSGNPLDRAEPRRRDAAWLRERLADEATRVLPLWKLAPLVRTGDAPRLAWATPALLDISKARGDVFLDRLEARLAAAGARVRRYRKPTFTKPAPVDLRQQIAVDCGAVIEALAD